MMVVFAFDAPIKNFWEGLFLCSLAIALFFYPVCFFVGLIMTRLKSEEAKEKAKFWLGLPWKIIGVCFLAVLIVGLIAKMLGA
jgi:ABC-type antimicrobial peptide transport system permease subunit